MPDEFCVHSGVELRFAPTGVKAPPKRKTCRRRVSPHLEATCEEMPDEFRASEKEAMRLNERGAADGARQQGQPDPRPAPRCEERAGRPEVAPLLLLLLLGSLARSPSPFARAAPGSARAPSAPSMDEAAAATAAPRPPEACRNRTGLLRSGQSPASAAVMFSAGVLGNLTALALLLLARRRRRARRARLAPFHVLSMALVLTDLLGTCLLSPVVLAAYARDRRLWRLAAGGRVCRYFAFAMSFFGLATTGCLGAMALERGLALGAPYLYQRLLRGRPVALLLGALLPALYGLAAAFCALPLLGFGRYVQYPPGTWCFIQMRLPRPGEPPGCEGEALSAERGVLAFSLLYASLLLLLVLAVLLCNLVVGVNLVRMHRRGQPARRVAAAAAASCSPGAQRRPLRPLEAPHGPRGARRPLSLPKELEHLVLLSIMTITFVVCSLPFTIRAFVNSFWPNGDFEKDLEALRFLSANSIIDPWVFTILRPSVLRLLWSVLCCRGGFKSRTKKSTSPLAKSKPVGEIASGRQ
ncbi:prostaglandin E2 receptor EP2 subtype-like [Elgaria multicarinata webbii]|uniref:prostaglandin E2 receptor EP2 subtype-like n=1 Tax=Elgaria multicarinata webbii TaxID=159646 RepID=UPI002FCD3593